MCIRDRAKPVLGVFLQRARRAAGRAGLHQPDLLRGGDGRVGLDCDWQRVAVAALAGEMIL